MNSILGEMQRQDQRKNSRGNEVGSSTKESIFVHNVAVRTGDKRGAGTNSKVWIELFDEKREGSGKIMVNFNF